jgi:hypothetical protein
MIKQGFNIFDVRIEGIDSIDIDTNFGFLKLSFQPSQNGRGRIVRAVYFLRLNKPLILPCMASMVSAISSRRSDKLMSDA